MPVDWKQLSGYERAHKILNNIEGLTYEDLQSCYDEWAEMTFEPTVIGVIQSEAALQEIGIRHLLKRLGKWEDEEQRQKDNLERTLYR